jgi:hypothetical protein
LKEAFDWISEGLAGSLMFYPQSQRV